MKLYIDIETKSSVDISKGVELYTEDKDFDILMASYALEDGPVKTVDLTREKIPADLFSYLLGDTPVTLVAYNATFEIVALGKYLGRMAGLNRDELESFLIAFAQRWEDAWVTTKYYNRVGSLDWVGEFYFDLAPDQAKDKDGKRLIKLFSVPDKDGNFTAPEDAMEDWKKYLDYNAQDVEAMRNILNRLGEQPEQVRKDWLLDFRINRTGVPIDVDMIPPAMQCDEETKEEAKRLMQVIMGQENVSDNELKKYIKTQSGYTINSLNKKDIPYVLFQLENYPNLITLVKLRMAKNQTSTAKFKAMQNMAGEDGIIRHSLNYYGSSTGRFSSRGVQFQNMKRNYLPNISHARELLKAWDFESLKSEYQNFGLSDTISQLTRTVIAPQDPNKTLIINDYSNIESRVLSSVAGEEWRIKAFKEGQDLYCVTASRLFNIPLEKVLDKDAPEHRYRSDGKICELFLGYSGGKGSLLAQPMYEGTEEEAQELVTKWRDANPNIIKLWNTLASNAMTAYRLKTIKRFKHGIAFRMDGRDLVMRLPSGRELYYPDVKVTQNQWGMDQLEYRGKVSKNNQVIWSNDISLWRGIIVENLIQAISRDLLVHALRRLTEEGFKILFHVHDEVVIETDKETAEEDLKRVQEIMSEIPEWGRGWLDGLIKSEGFISDFYMKD